MTARPDAGAPRVSEDEPFITAERLEQIHAERAKLVIQDDEYQLLALALSRARNERDASRALVSTLQAEAAAMREALTKAIEWGIWTTGGVDRSLLPKERISFLKNFHKERERLQAISLSPGAGAEMLARLERAERVVAECWNAVKNIDAQSAPAEGFEARLHAIRAALSASGETEHYRGLSPEENRRP